MINWDAEHILTTSTTYIGNDDDDDENCLQPVPIKMILFFSNLIF